MHAVSVITRINCGCMLNEMCETTCLLVPWILVTYRLGTDAVLRWSQRLAFCSLPVVLDCSNNTVGVNKVLEVTTMCVSPIKRTTKGVVCMNFTFLETAPNKNVHHRQKNVLHAFT